MSDPSLKTSISAGFEPATFFYVSLVGDWSPLSLSTVGVTEISFSVPPRGLQHWRYIGLNSTYIEHWTERCVGLLERHLDKCQPHGETGSTFTNIMASMFNQITDLQITSLNALPSEVTDSWQFLTRTESHGFSVTFEELLAVVHLWRAQPPRSF